MKLFIMFLEHDFYIKKLNMHFGFDSPGIVHFKVTVADLTRPFTNISSTLSNVIKFSRKATQIN